MNIIKAIRDKNLFQPWFKENSWDAWQVVLKCTFGIPLTPQEQSLFQEHTKRQTPPTDVEELWLIVGRRGGKSFIAALMATYLAFFIDWKQIFKPGERGVGMMICPDRNQGRVVMGYIMGFINEIPLLKNMVDRTTKESVYLNNGIVIEIHTASYRTIRGYTAVFSICDEIAFWRDDTSANPDREILNALRPAMATIANSKLICISTPYSRRGVLWDSYRRYYGEPGSILVWQAPSKTMNPTLPDRTIQQAYEQDPSAAAAEYDAQFRRDVEAFISREAVEVCVVTGRTELPPNSEIEYVAFVDPSGGSQDSMTMAISHQDDEKRILDAIREVRPPFSPEDVVREFVQLLRRYRIDSVSGDRYGGEWVADAFLKYGIQYESVSDSKSDLYRELLPLINSRQVELLDDQHLINQICNLERRATRGGRDSIDHMPGTHDDVVNAAAGALVLSEVYEPFFI